MAHQLLLTHLWADQTGSDLMEYGLIGCLVAVAAITSVLGYMNPLKSAWNYLSSTLVNTFGSIT
jgi:Flp pilus assembly pilin Flp